MSSAPPVRAPERQAPFSRRMAGPLVTALGVGGAWVGVILLRPGDAGPTPCPWRWLTGLDCPFCGATRSAADLAAGDVVSALDHNALFVLVILPLAVLAWLAWTARAWRGAPAWVVSNRLVLGLGAVTLAWWALRLAVPWLGSTAA